MSEETPGLQGAEWKLTKPDGTVVPIGNLKKYCDENGMDYGALIELRVRQNNPYKDYKLEKLTHGE